MTRDEILRLIIDGRTDLVTELMKQDGWRESLAAPFPNPIDWFIYYNDTTALRLVHDRGGAIPFETLGARLNSAAFFGHWKVCDFLLGLGADPNHQLPRSRETALHSALCKANRPHFIYTVRVLLDHGANPNAQTADNMPTDAFMRDVRTRGETPLHRAAAYADPEIIRLLLDRGADKERRDAHGDTPLGWASMHLRPGSVLALLAYGDHRISQKQVSELTSDHGAGWGNGMERNLMGGYRPLSSTED
ncbi:ankyrin repeat domain-containing protein [Parvularcula lutaonensis]|uniref:Ankyrin repeat domain-containing protein n=1 Tax=Parvularcula lutaonensis TaxID=491923 RepID=A0ABV7MA33_9PROT|nr:ankyrin repeat domain-containing protein [Parvularcula lutaonensis]GGY36164.1 hypothetical protein GCM10007148_00370 [Parvularcula lutaonensis]